MYTQSSTKTRHPSHTGGTFQKGEKLREFAAHAPRVPAKLAVTAGAEQMEQHASAAGTRELRLPLARDSHEDESEAGVGNLSRNRRKLP